MFRARLRKLNQRGDTIVEVLIAITVVSMVLGGAYTTTNRSLLASRSAQEQGVAIKLVEGQLEQLKALADIPAGLASAPGSFCILPVSGTPTLVSTASAGAPCSLNNQGTTATATDQPAYKITITEPTPDNFKISNTWTNVTGSQTDYVEMSYRIYAQ